MLELTQISENISIAKNTQFIILEKEIEDRISSNSH